MQQRVGRICFFSDLSKLGRVCCCCRSHLSASASRPQVTQCCLLPKGGCSATGHQSCAEPCRCDTFSATGQRQGRALVLRGVSRLERSQAAFEGSKTLPRKFPKNLREQRNKATGGEAKREIRVRAVLGKAAISVAQARNDLQ